MIRYSTPVQQYHAAHAVCPDPHPEDTKSHPHAMVVHDVLWLAGLYDSEADSDMTSSRRTTFFDNTASKGGGAMHIIGTDNFKVSNTMFTSNKADFGGAVYIASTDGKTTEFSHCVFEGNKASDGGALYLYTGAGMDIVTGSIFRGNSASKFPSYAVPTLVTCSPRIRSCCSRPQFHFGVVCTDCAVHIFSEGCVRHGT